LTGDRQHFSMSEVRGRGNRLVGNKKEERRRGNRDDYGPLKERAQKQVCHGDEELVIVGRRKLLC